MSPDGFGIGLASESCFRAAIGAVDEGDLFAAVNIDKMVDQTRNAIFIVYADADRSSAFETDNNPWDARKSFKKIFKAFCSAIVAEATAENQESVQTRRLQVM